MTLVEVIEKLKRFRRRDATVHLFARQPWAADSECRVLVQRDDMDESDRERQVNELREQGFEMVGDEGDVMNSVYHLSQAGIDDPVPEEICEVLLNNVPRE